MVPCYLFFSWYYGYWPIEFALFYLVKGIEIWSMLRTQSKTWKKLQERYRQYSTYIFHLMNLILIDTGLFEHIFCQLKTLFDINYQSRYSVILKPSVICVVLLVKTNLRKAVLLPKSLTSKYSDVPDAFMFC